MIVVQDGNKADYARSDRLPDPISDADTDWDGEIVFECAPKEPAYQVALNLRPLAATAIDNNV